MWTGEQDTFSGMQDIKMKTKQNKKHRKLNEKHVLEKQECKEWARHGTQETQQESPETEPCEHLQRYVESIEHKEQL